MRINYFLYFFLLASSLDAEAPLSAIDWLSIKKNDVESSLKSVEKESSDTNKDIQVSTLSSDKFQSIGLLPVYVTGIPTTIWRNSSFNDDLIDEFCLSVSPRAVGGENPPPFLNHPVDSPVELSLNRILLEEEFLFCRYLTIR